MIITRRVAGRPTGMPARPYRTVRYGRALSPVLSVLASLFPFHDLCPVLVLGATADRLSRSTPCGTLCTIIARPFVSSSWVVPVSTGVERARCTGTTSVSHYRRALARVTSRLARIIDRLKRVDLPYSSTKVVRVFFFFFFSSPPVKLSLASVENFESSVHFPRRVYLFSKNLKSIGFFMWQSMLFLISLGCLTLGWLFT